MLANTFLLFVTLLLSFNLGVKCQDSAKSSFPIGQNLLSMMCSESNSPDFFLQIEDLRFSFFKNLSTVEAYNISEVSLYSFRNSFLTSCKEAINIPLFSDQALCITADNTLHKFSCANSKCTSLNSIAIQGSYVNISDVTSQYISILTTQSNTNNQQGIILQVSSLKIVKQFDIQNQFASIHLPKIVNDKFVVFLHQETDTIDNQQYSIVKYEWKFGIRTNLVPKLTKQHPQIVVLDSDLIFVVCETTFDIYNDKGKLIDNGGYSLASIYPFNSSHLFIMDPYEFYLGSYDIKSKQFIQTKGQSYAQKYRQALQNKLILFQVNDNQIVYASEGDTFVQESLMYCTQQTKNESDFLDKMVVNIPVQLENGNFKIAGRFSYATYDKNFELQNIKVRSSNDYYLNKGFFSLERKSMFSYYESDLVYGSVYEFNVETNNLQQNYYFQMPKVWGNNQGRIVAILNNTNLNKPAFLYYLNNATGTNTTVSAVFKDKVTQLFSNIDPLQIIGSFDDSTQVVTFYTILNNQNGRVMKYQYNINQDTLIEQVQLSASGSAILVDKNHALISDYIQRKAWLEYIPKNITIWEVGDLPEAPAGGYLGYLGYDSNSQNIIKGFIVIDSSNNAFWGYDLISKKAISLSLSNAQVGNEFRLYQSGPNQIFITQQTEGYYIKYTGFTYTEESGELYWGKFLE